MGGAKKAACSLARLVKRISEPGRIFAVVERRVRGIWKHNFIEPMLGMLPEAKLIAIRGGESGKTLDNVQKIFEKLIALKADRYDLVVAVGGGALTDTAGFAASCYMRGIRWISVPTTLIGQIDAGIGGKTGVDLPDAKNAVGSFWNPVGAFIVPELLRTLPGRQIRSGLSEAMKIGQCCDPGILSYMEKTSELLLNAEIKALTPLIDQCVKSKMSVVADDPQDRNGRRALLNLGHTVGHAIEAAGAFRTWTHGEAVAMGLLVINSLAVRLGAMKVGEERRIFALSQKLGLVPKKKPEPEEILPYLDYDKKKKGDQLMIVIPGPLGQAKIGPVRPGDLTDRKYWSWR